LCQSIKVRWLSKIQLLQSIDRSFKETRKVLQAKKKLFSIDQAMIRSLILLLRPFKHVLTVIQKGKEPSLHLVLICVLTLRKALGSFDKLVEFNNENKEPSSTNDNEIEDDQYELEPEEPEGEYQNDVT
jgi:inorganic triphosphatase YgiF